MPVLNDFTLLGLLQDDVPYGDLTTDSLGIGSKLGHAEFRARQPMTACGTEEAVRLFELVGTRARLATPSGTQVNAGELMLDAQGTAASLHRAWKAALTLVEWSSGVATGTAAIVAAANGVPVACTRKNVPGTKALSAKAVKAGGGIMHRLGLSESLLVFAQHRLFLNEPAEVTIQRLHRAQPEKKLVVEVANVTEALLWAHAGADVLQLEKFSPEAVAACRQALQDSQFPVRPLLAATGGIRADNARAYVAAGADFLVTSAPYWAPPGDVQFTLVPAA